MSNFDLGILPDVLHIVMLLILPLTVVVIGAWLIERMSKAGIFPDTTRQLREVDSFDHSQILRKLLSTYPQKFRFGDIIEVLARCYPRVKEVWGEDSYSNFWFWILMLETWPWRDQPFKYAFVAGYYDPNQYDPMTKFNAWLFRSLEEAEECPRKEMQSHAVFKLCPGQKLYEYLVAQIEYERK
jgi:hypothetical protein